MDLGKALSYCILYINFFSLNVVLLDTLPGHFQVSFTSQESGAAAIPSIKCHFKFIEEIDFTLTGCWSPSISQ
jgi:hypothetical protein